jgi:hypothetical protein
MELLNWLANLILGMDWLVAYTAQIDCFTKVVTLQGEGGVLRRKKCHTE